MRDHRKGLSAVKGTTVVTRDEARRAVERGWHAARLIGPGEDGSRHAVLDLSRWAYVRNLEMYLKVATPPDAAVVRLIEDGAHVELEGQLYIIDGDPKEFTREITRKKMPPASDRLLAAPKDFRPGANSTPAPTLKRHEDVCEVCRAYLDHSLANWFDVRYDEPIADALFAKSFPRNSTHCTFRACELRAADTGRETAVA
jgi:hypothetical protein